MSPNKIEAKRIVMTEDGIKVSDRVTIRIFSPNGKSLLKIIDVETDDIENIISALEKIREQTKK